MRVTMPVASPRRPRSGEPRWHWFMVAAAAVVLGWIGWELWRSPSPEPQTAPAPLPAPEPQVRKEVPPESKTNAVVTGLPAPTPVPAVTNVPVPATPVIAKPAGGPTNGYSERMLAAQVALARQGLSPGSLDGRAGSQTRAAVRAFQLKSGLRVTGALNEETEARLALDSNPLLKEYVVSVQDLSRLTPLSKTWLGKSQQDRLEYETILELVAERHQSHPQLIKRLNPDVDWSAVTPGSVITVPNIEPPLPTGKAAYIKIYLSYRILQAFDAEGRLLAHFPCSIAQRMDKRPVGVLRVEVVAKNPNYTFNPEIFPESEEARRLGRKLMIHAGPNNPVGTVWIGLDRPGYGIHGTPRPEEVGRTESHGCFRLANWNAEHLFKLAWPGMPVLVEP